MKIAGETEAQIAFKLGVSPAQVWKDVKKRLEEVRRDDRDAVEQEWALQNSRYERLLLRWWPIALGNGDKAALATDKVLHILQRIDVIGGLVPEKPLIQINQDNRQVNVYGDVRDQLRDRINSLAARIFGEQAVIEADGTDPE